MTPKLTPAMRSVIERMASGWQRLVVTRSSQRVTIGVGRCSLATLRALDKRELIEYDQAKSNGWQAVYRLTEAGRELLKG